MKSWIALDLKYFDKSLGIIPSEINEIDWKIPLSPNNDKLCKHISALANLPGGGFLAFGIDDKTGKVQGMTKSETIAIVERLSSLCRDGVEPLVSIDHSIETYRNEEILIVYLKESVIKPVHLNGKTIEESHIRSGGTTRRASRQEIGGLIMHHYASVLGCTINNRLKYRN